MKQVLPLLVFGTVLAFGDGSGLALAEEDLPPEIAAPADDVSQPTPQLLAGPVLDDEQLAENRGGANTHFNNMRVTGSVSDVAASDLITGHNIITEGALAGANGIPMFIQNSGNGVLIQNAVIVNIEMN